MYCEIEESIRKNLVIYLSHHICKSCFKPYSSNTIVEIDDLAFIFSEKVFYKLDCSVSNNINAIKKAVRNFNTDKNRYIISLLKPYLHGNILRFELICDKCWEISHLEYNLSKYDGSKNYLR